MAVEVCSPESQVAPASTQPKRNPRTRNDDFYRLGLFVLCVIAISVRAVDVWRPVDGSVWESWREPDVAGIARNYFREDMNLFYPRIDWRGDGPGYVESEFPIYPWLVACLYHVFGYHEEFLRVVSYCLMLGTCLVFYRLAQKILPQKEALAAFAVFAVHPMAIRMASSIQPEPLMFFAYLSAVYFFVCWCENEHRRDYWAALFLTTLAILAKVPAAHIGLLFACLCFQRFGWKALSRRDVYVFACVSLAIPFLWYAHARGIWSAYGNSLGISNEAYARMSSSSFLEAVRHAVPGLLRIETEYVWTRVGLLLGVFGIAAIYGHRERRILGYWFLTLAAFYCGTARTTCQDWAAYYHIVSVPLAALAIGAAITHANRVRVPAQQWRLCAYFLISVGVIVCFLSSLPIDAISRLNRLQPYAILIGMAGGLMLATEIVRFDGGYSKPLSRARGLIRGFVPAVLLTCFAATLVLECRQFYSEVHPHRCQELYNSAVAFRSSIERGSLIVASGSDEVDSNGFQAAYNAPYMFFWTDTKGFTIGNAEQSLEKLEEFHHRGARYFIGERHSLDAKPGFEDQLREHYRVLQERDNAILIELTSDLVAHR